MGLKRHEWFVPHSKNQREFPPGFYIIGDALIARTGKEAMYEGARIGRQISSPLPSGGAAQEGCADRGSARARTK